MRHDMEDSGSKHFVIPDGQNKEGVPMDHWEWCGRYIVDKRPKVVICLGDFADMPSLSTYDAKGSKLFENRRYAKDIAAAHHAMNRLMRPLWVLQGKQQAEGTPVYRPRLVMLYGNHEDRITRAINADPAMNEGRMSLDDLAYERFGWETVPFLQPINIDGVVYSHYFSNGLMGRPITRAAALLTKKHMSCVAGHQQGRDIAYGQRADGKTITALIAGSFYQHEEDYLNTQTNNHWRGIYVLHEVKDGEFDEMAVSLNYLAKRYGGQTVIRQQFELPIAMPHKSSEDEDEEYYGHRSHVESDSRRSEPAISFVDATDEKRADSEDNLRSRPAPRVQVADGARYCSRHPGYKVKRKPKADCAQCWQMWHGRIK